MILIQRKLDKLKPFNCTYQGIIQTWLISTKPLNVEVKRKYAYFLKLRQMLSKFYPGIRLPYL